MTREELVLLKNQFIKEKKEFGAYRQYREVYINAMQIYDNSIKNINILLNKQ